MKLPTNSRCVKYLMFIFNLMFVITGIILLAFGATIHAVFNNHQHFLDNRFLSASNLLIAIGSIIFFIAFFGCCGAVRENYCMIITFASLMILVFILELSGGIAGYVLRNEARDVIEKKMTDNMPNYNQNGSESRRVWDELQHDFACCGVNGPHDWLKYLNKDNSTINVPASCCNPVNKDCVFNSTDTITVGCLNKFGASIRGHAVQLGGVGIGIAFIQVIGVWFAIHLARAIRTSYETV